MITYHNVYKCIGRPDRPYVCLGNPREYDPIAQNHQGQYSKDWIRLEMHINGHWFRPPVSSPSIFDPDGRYSEWATREEFVYRNHPHFKEFGFVPNSINSTWSDRLFAAETGEFFAKVLRTPSSQKETSNG